MQCPKCRSSGVMTEWRPSKGIDPGMREYKCPGCKKVFYASRHRPQKVQEVKSK